MSAFFGEEGIVASSQNEDPFRPLWKYVTIIEKGYKAGGNVSFQCNYCQRNFQGSYSRVKAHLLKLPGVGISSCVKVLPQHLSEMKKLSEEAEMKKTNAMPKKVSLPSSSHASTNSKYGAKMGLVGITSFKLDGCQSKKRKSGGNTAIEKAFDIQCREELHSEIARMFYSGGLPFHFARNPYYVSSYSFATNHNIPGYLPPSYNMLRTTLLQKEKANIERCLQPIKSTWRAKGVTIVSDGWSDPQRRPLINFMAVTESGPMFLKAINCEGEFKDKWFISEEILKVIAEVGPANVVQVITDNAPVCKAAGLLIESKYPHIFWTPCIVHTLNLALKNICSAKNTESNGVAFEECNWIIDVVDEVMMIKNFIMNHSMRLSIFNEFVPLKLLAVADTRFASVIVLLKRFKLIKRGFQAMAISEKWSCYKEDDTKKAEFVKEKVFNDLWWDKIDYILSFTGPIYDMLRMADTDTHCLHLIYEGWDSMIEKIKKVIYRHEEKQDHEESSFFSVVYNILIDQWTRSNTPLHCLAHSLNPRYYSEAWLQEVPNRVAPHKDEEISKERKTCLKRLFPNSEDLKKIYIEFTKFSTCMEAFSDYDFISQREDMESIFWWATHGSSTPMLQTIALKLLGQPSSSSCCERNWSTYSFIHSVRRNKLAPQRAEDLAFVHNNLRLLSRKKSQYMEGDNTMWDIGGDSFDQMDGTGLLSVADLSLDEPDFEAILFTDEGCKDDNQPIDLE